MKIIWPDNVTAVLASSEATGGYVDDNVLDDWPDSCWKANATTAQTLTITVAAPDAVLVGYTNYSGSLTYTAKNSGGSTVEAGSLTAIASDDGVTYHYWYEPASDIATIVFSFGVVSSAVTVGIVRAGDMINFQNIEYGATESDLRYGVILRTNKGNRYVVNGDVSRKYSGTILTQNSSGICPLISLARKINLRPFACKVIDATYDMCGLWYFDGDPIASKIAPGYNRTSFTLEEAARA